MERHLPSGFVPQAPAGRRPYGGLGGWRDCTGILWANRDAASVVRPRRRRRPAVTACATAPTSRRRAHVGGASRRAP